MNILGHWWVAEKVAGKLSPEVMAGAHLPDIVPFCPGSVFSFEEIHEGGEKVLLPNKELGLGMMTHGVKFGADGFNKEIEEWMFEGKEEIKEELAKEIMEAANVTWEVAIGPRIHNWLWQGLDLYIFENQKGFVVKCAEIWPKIKTKRYSEVLATTFDKPVGEVYKNVDYFCKIIEPEKIKTLEGLFMINKKMVEGLPEKDKINDQKAIELSRKIYVKYKDRWESALSKVTESVKLRLEPYL